ncbi:signal recognition particle-docking protein FtsY [Candidatus Woesearchaeota archaeon]|nr:signal recognition particle-docking protein FtsY [Candidatus Woesearchaeota archaeon]
MFGLFKKKLKEVVSKFSRKTEEEPKEKAVEEEKEIKELKEEKPKKRFSLFKKKHKEELTEEKIEEKKEEIKKEIKEKKSEEIKEEKPKEKKTFLEKVKGITKVKISEEKFEKLFEDLEMVLLENNVAYGVIDKIKEDLKVDLVNVPLSNVKKTIETSLKNSIEGVLSFGNIDLIKRIKEKKPYVILFLGVNGAGKTTTIAKLANLFLKNGLRCVFVASDTFRAASIQQLEEHGKILGINVIKHDYGADPAAVAYDGIKHAESKNIDVVLIDTAGRQHSNVNLMDELKKLNRVAKPDFKIFVGESITGNDIIEQVEQFNNAVNIDGIILSKFDVDDKGGAAISVSYVTGKPILYLGIGQDYDKLEKFDKEKIIKNLEL